MVLKINGLRVDVRRSHLRTCHLRSMCHLRRCHLRTWLLKVAPPDDRSEIGVRDAHVSYEHNDIDTRPESEDERQRCLDNGWDVDDPEVLQRWRDQEPINAHSHLAAMLLGCSETVPVTRGKLQIGQWQSVMLVDTDGPRERKVGIQVIGFK